MALLHRAYPKISQTLAQATLGDSRWVATEKLHGAPDRAPAVEAVIEEAVLDVWIDLESMFPRRMRSLDDEDETQLRSVLLELVVARSAMQ